MSKIITMQEVVSMVLSQGNEDQNQHYPPRVIDDHFNILTNAILDSVNRQYPTNRSIVEIAKPFLVLEDVPVVKGVIPLPKDVRHLLGITIFNKDGEPCTRQEADLSEEEIEQIRLDYRDEGATDVEIVSTTRFNSLAKHAYKKVSLDNPKAAIFTGEGVRIKPSVPMAQINYLRAPKVYKYGYKMNPDDTYYWDKATSTESEWEETAADLLFKGMNILYANLVRDQVQMSAAQVLKESGLL